MTRPRLLDLFCGAGGAAVGYHRGGFEVVGIDLEPQRNYPFTFHRGDALTLGAEMLANGEFVAVHASPPCKVHTALKAFSAAHHVNLIPQTRDVLMRSGLPYVMENVPGAPLLDPLTLCGSMFGLGAAGRILRRHRLFESSAKITAPRPCACQGQRVGSVYGNGGGGAMFGGGSYRFPVKDGRVAMGMHWTTRAELSEAIPPAYTEHIGKQLLACL